MRAPKVSYHHAADGWHIILHAANGAKLGPIGEAYGTRADARKGFRRIAKAAAGAVEVDG